METNEITATIAGKTLALTITRGTDIEGPAGEVLEMWWVKTPVGAILGGGSKAEAHKDAVRLVRSFVKTGGIALAAHAK